ncbi:MAG: hypothetical protein AVDCRST_MAG08-3013, partial [uncultured Acetobacteraceae bacterium]
DGRDRRRGAADVGQPAFRRWPHPRRVSARARRLAPRAAPRLPGGAHLPRGGHGRRRRFLVRPFGAGRDFGAGGVPAEPRAERRAGHPRNAGPLGRGRRAGGRAPAGGVHGVHPLRGRPLGAAGAGFRRDRRM